MAEALVEDVEESILQMIASPSESIDRFDYDSLDEPIRDDVRRHRDEIRAHYREGCGHIVAIGRCLIAVKAFFGHGRFGDWLDAEFGWTHRTATNYMNAARLFGGVKLETVSNIEPTALHMLGTKAGEQVRERFLTQAERGGRVSAREVRKAIEALQPTDGEERGADAASEGTEHDPPHSFTAADVVGFLAEKDEDALIEWATEGRTPREWQTVAEDMKALADGLKRASDALLAQAEERSDDDF